MMQTSYDTTATVLFILIMLNGYALSQSCSPDTNSEGIVIPTTDLPTAGEQTISQQTVV